MLIVTVIAGLLIAFNQNDVDDFNSRADAYRFKEQYNEAISDHTKAILLDSDNVYAYYRRGDLYRRTSQWNLARADLNQVLQLDPDHEPARASLKAVESSSKFLSEGYKVFS